MGTRDGLCWWHKVLHKVGQCRLILCRSCFKNMQSRVFLIQGAAGCLLSAPFSSLPRKPKTPPAVGKKNLRILTQNWFSSLIVVFSVHFDKCKFFPFQQISISINSFLSNKLHTLLKHKMLQFLYSTAPTCFGPHGPSSGSTYQNLIKIILSLKISVKTLR
jgi:hypothetical protein